MYHVVSFAHYLENMCTSIYRPINYVCTIYYMCLSTGTFSVVLVDLEILGSADVHGWEAAWEIRGNPP